MSPPSKAQVRKEVVRQISTHTDLSPKKIQGSHELKKSPLHFDDIGLKFLAASLRGYVKQYNPEATVKSPEVRKSGLTVDGFVELIQKKVGAV